MVCKKHNKKNLDCWYDCSECSEEIIQLEKIIILEMEVISKRINRPITKVLQNIIHHTEYHPSVNERLRLKKIPLIEPHKTDCTCGCQSLPF